METEKYEILIAKIKKDIRFDKVGVVTAAFFFAFYMLMYMYGQVTLGVPLSFGAMAMVWGNGLLITKRNLQMMELL